MNIMINNNEKDLPEYLTSGLPRITEVIKTPSSSLLASGLGTKTGSEQ